MLSVQSLLARASAKLADAIRSACNHLVIALALVVGFKSHAAEADDADAMVFFFSLVTGMAAKDSSLAMRFLTTKLDLSEDESDQVIALAHEVLDEHRKMGDSVVETICTGSARFGIQEIKELKQLQDNKLEQTVVAGFERLDTRTANTYASFQIKNWVSKELRGSLTTVDPLPMLTQRGVDIHKVRERLCSNQPEPINLNPVSNLREHKESDG